MKKISIILLALLSFASCKSINNVSKKEATEHKTHWSYTGEEGPNNWSHISEKYKDCAGSAQSPINIDESKTIPAKKAHHLNVNYQNSDINIINNGHTVQFNISKGNTIELDGKKYELKQFHMHSLSEHTINGEHLPLEIHFVNKADDGTYAVIGVFYEEGETSPFFDTFLNHFPKKVGEFKKAGTFNINQVLANTQHFYHYSGSFTTPPCTEIVEWIVLKDKKTASKKQLEKLHHLLHDNFRPVQNLNGRVVENQ